ncbi:hypothetical protein EHI8A_003050 [Entamoeba histolytica HM-1:IMSS-B]|uniref:Uncharacterized protein n=5 Tax=Entamoeba histolytica TaxID=5759 RepID=C4LWF4_ENTH1|nr:hypothetical protein EHI_096410 [Entamoeba histolytica HM-1:IMSS]EMD47637.1 Hypothetical protein EHI5A_005180 [Entamoeba histolytica KU27]EMH77783.1 hypothetical protein EHI8A_003050 [Entamoeba histolytica HM-1:IMSS-B]ENY64812.1 hypothetical protein EHI7A_001520 [Entamoeba histolytica HM-1:IMSS-A]GAT93038.1 hypothetical protein CL6EHI_096410 [Entamoeba histolytica]EAL51539.1 hypothetical protein EHI_096410 [Entamoeba histolytica HM-1:IMSS]|eukprot:XP_656917.1 hypothetical protein EHI_096410 [Entamoeba histolytica HM-1:IMSS]
MTLVEDSNPFDDGYVAPEPQDKSMSCSLKVLAVISTAFGFIGALIVFFMEKKNQYIRLTACHSAFWHIILDTILLILLLLMFINNWFFYTIFVIYAVIFFLFYIFLIVMAVFRCESGDAFLVPGVSKLVEYIESRL